jgi:WD40-like Beta Propeller Repeat
MSDHDIEQRLSAWYAADVRGSETAPPSLYESLAALAESGQPPVGLFGTRRGMLLMAAAALLVTLVVGAIAVGAGLVSLPTPAPSLVVAPSGAEPSPAEPSPSPSPEPPAGLVAYSVLEELQPGDANCTEGGPAADCLVTHIWLSNADGSGAHTLQTNPDDYNFDQLIGWTPDGSALVYQSGGSGNLVLADTGGVELRHWTRDDLCAYPCSGGEGIAFSPDGTRLAFVRGYGDVGNSTVVENSTVVAILDLASGQVTELESTRTTNASFECWISPSCEGTNEYPRWSPDGSRLLFGRQVMSPEPGSAWTSAAVLVVNPDGTGLHRVTPTGWYAIDASWSPDGSRLVFLNVEMIVNDDRTSVLGERTDIYTVLPDGSELRRLTEDEISIRPDWTADGRLTFARIVGAADAIEFENWIMDADGGNQTRLGDSLAELTAAGCLTCLYPLPRSQDESLTDAFWQPIP